MRATPTLPGGSGRPRARAGGRFEPGRIRRDHAQPYAHHGQVTPIAQLLCFPAYLSVSLAGRPAPRGRSSQPGPRPTVDWHAGSCDADRRRLPRNEFGGDVGAVGAYAQGVVQLGYPHLLAFDHLVGADPAVHKGRAGPRSADSSPLITAEDSSSRSKRSFRGLDRGLCRDNRATGPERTASRPSWWPASAPLSVRRCSARAAPAPSRGSGRLFDTLKLWA